MNAEQQYMPIKPYFAENASESELRQELAQLDVQLGIGTPGNERPRPLKWVEETRLRARRDEVKRLLNSIERGKRQASLAGKPWRKHGPAIIRSHQGRFEDFFEVIPDHELSASERASLTEAREAVRQTRAVQALNRGQPVYAAPTPYWVEH